MRGRSALLSGLAVAVTGFVVTGSAVAGVFLPVSGAAYTDAVSAQLPDAGSGLKTRKALMVPTQTFLQNTAIALQDDGTLWVWGFRGNGLSGGGRKWLPSGDSPSAVVLPNDGYSGKAQDRRRIVSVAGLSNQYDSRRPKYSGIAALSDDGRVYTWGGEAVTMGRSDNVVPFTSPGVVGISEKVIDLKSTASFFLALTERGKLFAWGWCSELGNCGQKVGGMPDQQLVKVMENVHSIGSGISNAWAIKSDYRSDADKEENDEAGVFSLDAKSATFVATRSLELSAHAKGCVFDGGAVVMGSEKDTCVIRSLTGNKHGIQLITSQNRFYTLGDRRHCGAGREAGAAMLGEVILPGNDAVMGIANTGSYTMVLGNTGSVYVYGTYSTWTAGLDPQTGSFSDRKCLNAPTKIDVLKDVIAIGASQHHGAVLGKGGQYGSWGAVMSVQMMSDLDFKSNDGSGGESYERSNLIREDWANISTNDATNCRLTWMIPPGSSDEPATGRHP